MTNPRPDGPRVPPLGSAGGEAAAGLGQSQSLAARLPRAAWAAAKRAIGTR